MLELRLRCFDLFHQTKNIASNKCSETDGMEKQKHQLLCCQITIEYLFSALACLVLNK